ncbi:MAG: Ldh family oxidoreductase [Candidatus Saccharimonadales bacterium]
MNITTEELKAKLMAFAEAVVSTEEAEYYANEVIEAHIRKSPRTDVLGSAVTDVEASRDRKDTEITYDVDLPSFVSINFHGHGPLTYIKRIHDELEDRANKNGLAMAAFTNGKSMHTLHTWVQGLAKRGLVAIAVCNGGPNAVIPFNGTRGLFGTNPMAYGLPGKNGEIFCVDMATSEIPFFEFMDSLKNDKPLREQSAVDQNGEFTTDAKNAVASRESTDPTTGIVPMGGGYKGYYIVYLMEVLTSALVGMPSSPEMTEEFVPEEHGAILIAMSPKAFGTEATFNRSVEVLHKSIKSQKPKAGETIRVPGEENSRRFAEAGSAIDVDDTLMDKIAAQ